MRTKTKSGNTNSRCEKRCQKMNTLYFQSKFHLTPLPYLLRLRACLEITTVGRLSLESTLNRCRLFQGNLLYTLRYHYLLYVFNKKSSNGSQNTRFQTTSMQSVNLQLYMKKTFTTARHFTHHVLVCSLNCICFKPILEFDMLQGKCCRVCKSNKIVGK